MQTIRVKVTTKGLPAPHDVSYATSRMTQGTPEKTVAKLNKLAVEHKVDATYELATEEQYWAYRNALNAAINS